MIADPCTHFGCSDSCTDDVLIKYINEKGEKITISVIESENKLSIALFEDDEE